MSWGRKSGCEVCSWCRRMPSGGVLIVFLQPCQSSELWIFTVVWDHASTTRQERKRWWEVMSVVIKERAEPGQALLQEDLEGVMRRELCWLPGQGTLHLPARGAKLTAAMTSACVVSLPKQPQMGCILFLLFTGASFLNYQELFWFLTPEMYWWYVSWMLFPTRNQGTLDMAANSALSMLGTLISTTGDTQSL